MQATKEIQSIHEEVQSYSELHKFDTNKLSWVEGKLHKLATSIQEIVQNYNELPDEYRATVVNALKVIDTIQLLVKMGAAATGVGAIIVGGAHLASNQLSPHVMEALTHKNAEALQKWLPNLPANDAKTIGALLAFGTTAVAMNSFEKNIGKFAGLMNKLAPHVATTAGIKTPVDTKGPKHSADAFAHAADDSVTKGKAPNKHTDNKLAEEISSGAGMQKHTVKFPENDAQIKHIFRNDPLGGHVHDTPINRQHILEAVNEQNFVLKTRYGVDVYSKALKDGRQVWVEIWQGVVSDAGINSNPINLLERYKGKL